MCSIKKRAIDEILVAFARSTNSPAAPMILRSAGACEKGCNAG
jgi:hypothetical protein